MSFHRFDSFILQRFVGTVILFWRSWQFLRDFPRIHDDIRITLYQSKWLNTSWCKVWPDHPALRVYLFVSISWSSRSLRGWFKGRYWLARENWKSFNKAWSPSRSLSHSLIHTRLYQPMVFLLIQSFCEPRTSSEAGTSRELTNYWHEVESPVR